MTAITQFNKQNLKAIREELNAALETVAKKHGLQIGLGGISFTDGSFTTKMTVVTKSKNGEASDDAGAGSGNEAVWAAKFKQYAKFYWGLNSEDLGRKVKVDGIEYTIAGARPKAKNPIVLKKANGTFIAVSANTVVAATK